MPANALTPLELLEASRRASDALVQAREEMRRAKTAEAAIAYCKAFQAARAARAATPPPRLVAP